jgi:hypothetical protein
MIESMGIFNKIRQNIHHGGVKVQIKAPSSVPENQVIPVTVTLTADSPQTIASVKAELRVQAKEEGVSIGNGVGVQQSNTTTQTIAQVESREAFSIAPGETKTVNLELYADGSGGGNALTDLSGGAGGAIKAVVSAVQTLDPVHYMYSIHASADVEGIVMDPGDEMPIQILPAAQPAH